MATEYGKFIRFFGPEGDGARSFLAECPDGHEWQGVVFTRDWADTPSPGPCPTCRALARQTRTQAGAAEPTSMFFRDGWDARDWASSVLAEDGTET